ncbi:MAG: (d)CMP kinase [Deltaproteobacteria bacterium]|nr:(d)CMP kinase [Deltaproteobacteria bacterium]
MRTRKRPIIAIDGPSGAGKTSVSKTLAARLGFTYIDTGAMYRSVGYLADRAGLLPEPTPALAELLDDLQIRFEPREDGQTIFANGEDMTAIIREHRVSKLASDFSAIPMVREKLIAIQRALGRDGGVVMEGRDIRNERFPDAELKVFLTAIPEERARRRYLELAQKNPAFFFDDVLADQAKRDENDSTRAVNPLRAAEDAWMLDSSNINLESVVDEIARRAHQIMRSA